MNHWKSTRVLLLLAASWMLLILAFKSSREADAVSTMAGIAVSEENSFVAGDLRVELSNQAGLPIYYTLDGSIPTLDSSLYEGAITMQASEEVQCCVVRAGTYNEAAGVWGDIFTRTYFYAENLQTIRDRFSTYIVCLTSDPYNLYDYEYGIMVEGKIRDEYRNSEEYISNKLTQPANFTQRGKDWERDVYVEILSPDGEVLVSQDAGMRIFGNASRQYYYKSFKLYARDEYGEDVFDYPLFSDNYPAGGEELQDSYERLVVRAHGFDKSVTLFREELFQRLCSQIDGIDSKSVAPASVWLNGSYYNFEWLQEVYDDLYMEENYGLLQYGDHYEIVTLRADSPTASVIASRREQYSISVEGPQSEGGVETEDTDLEAQKAAMDYRDVAAYAEKDLTDDRIFQELCSLIDMESLIQYHAIETYIGNWDWPLNNVKLYRYYSSNGSYGAGHMDGRWRYLYYDMEAGFNIYNEPEEDWLTIAQVMDEASLFGAVMQRQDMQEKFAEYMETCIQDYFTPEKVRAAMEQLCAERDGELEESFAYKQSVDETYTLDMDEVEQNKEVIYDFVERRPALIAQELQELFGIHISYGTLE